ncbi:MAG: pyridoxal-dependent decarboxylase, partial [bacterium]|nr:pyridoxal-dependent decarboxylase [bacterium]
DAVLGRLVAKQVNQIGTQTRGDDADPEAGFEQTHALEREAIFQTADAISNHPGTPDERIVHVPTRVDGYYCGGGTEGNLMGTWIGREWLRQFRDTMDRGIAVLCTAATHYSVHKATALLDIGQSRASACPNCGEPHIFVADPSGAGITLVGMTLKGEMDVGQGPYGPKQPGDADTTKRLPYGDLQRVFELKYEEGFRRFIIVATVGTTVMGAVDPVRRIAEFIRTRVHRSARAQCYLHVDASIGGFTAPFVRSEDEIIAHPGRDFPSFGFDIPEVMSVTMDGDKMGRLPYPGGVFLCRKGLQQHITRDVPYISGHRDDTVSGSRTCVAPVLAWYNIRGGRQEQHEYVAACMRTRALLRRKLSGQEFAGWVRLLPMSEYVNILPAIIALDEQQGCIPETPLLEPYQLRSDLSPGDPSDPRSCPVKVYKFCLWPHVRSDDFKDFVRDLARARNEWQRRRR